MGSKESNSNLVSVNPLLLTNSKRVRGLLVEDKMQSMVSSPDVQHFVCLIHPGGGEGPKAWWYIVYNPFSQFDMSRIPPQGGIWRAS